MAVENISLGETIAGWLLDFDIDSHALKQEHKNWLNTAVLLPMETESIRVASVQDDSESSTWTIWVVGTTSRTGSFQHNQALSQRRAESVRQYLAAALRNSSLVWNINTIPLSELPATVLGSRNDVENLVHRAVLVVVQQTPPRREPQRPVVQPPTQRISVDFYLYADRGAFMNVSKWQIEFYAVYWHKGQKYHYGWKGSASGLTVGPGDVTKAWTPSLPSLNKIFAGPADVTFPVPGALDKLNGKTIWLGARGGDMRLRIEDAHPEGGDLTLRMPFVTDSFELSQSIGSLNRRQPMPRDAKQELERVLRLLQMPTFREDGLIPA